MVRVISTSGLSADVFQSDGADGWPYEPEQEYREPRRRQRRRKRIVSGEHVVPTPNVVPLDGEELEETEW